MSSLFSLRGGADEALPPNGLPYKRTPQFDATTTPAGLLKRHNTKAGVWGKIVVLRGEVVYRILEPIFEEITLSPDRYGVVEPTVWHQVAPDPAACFYVEFYRSP